MKRGGSVAGNSFLLGAGTITTYAVSFLANVMLSRGLGPEHYGKYSFILSFCFLFSTGLDLGLHTLAVREISKDNGRTKVLFWDILLLKSVLAAFSLAVLWILARTLRLLDGLETLLLIGFANIACFSGLQFLLAICNGLREISAMALLSFGQKLCFVLLCALLFASSNLSIASALVANAIASFAFFAIVLAMLWKREQPTLGLSPPAYYLGLLRSSLPFAMSGLLVLLCTKLDITILNALSGDRETAMYQNAINISSVFLFIPSSLATAFFPVLSRLAIENEQEMRVQIKHALLSLLFLATPISIGLVLLAEPIVLLLWGAAYLGAVEPIKILGISLGVQFINSVLSLLLAATNRQALVAKVSLGSVVVNLAANGLLAPLYGAIGAAWAAMATNVFFFAAFFTLLRAYLAPTPGEMRQIPRFLACTAAYSGVLYGLLPYSLFIALPIATAVYVLLSVWLGIVPPKDVLRVKQVLRSMFANSKKDSS